MGASRDFSTGCLICKGLDGWYYPTIENPPGIFVEQSQADDRCLSLIVAEFTNSVVPLWREIQKLGGWVRTGFEVGREYGAINIRAHCFDFSTVVNLVNWRFGDSPPDDEHRRWVIEYPSATQGKYHRRGFWIATKYEVPDLDEWGRIRISEEQHRYNKERVRECLKRSKLRKAEKHRLQQLHAGQVALW